jgi:uncharacterized protein YbcI
MATAREDRQREPEQGANLLLQVSNAMVRVHKEFFGKGPTKAKSYMFDDFLLVVMREGLTTAEKTMLEFGHPNQVRQFRQLFQDEMTERLTGMIRELTGRRVVNYQSQVLFDPDITLEIFVFESNEQREPSIDATALAQLEDAASMGEADEDAPREPPAPSGQEKE